MAKESNRNFWIIGIILVIVAVFIFGNFGSLTGEAVAPKISANSCDDDSVCETNSLSVSDTMSIGRLRPDPQYELFIYKPSSLAEIKIEAFRSSLIILGEDTTELVLGTTPETRISTLSIQGDESILQFATPSTFWQLGLMDNTPDLQIKDVYTNSPRLIIRESGNVEIPGGLNT